MRRCDVCPRILFRFIIDGAFVGCENADAAPGTDEPEASQLRERFHRTTGHRLACGQRCAVIVLDIFFRIADLDRAFIGLSNIPKRHAEHWLRPLRNQNLAALGHDGCIKANHRCKAGNPVAARKNDFRRRERAVPRLCDEGCTVVANVFNAAVGAQLPAHPQETCMKRPQELQRIDVAVVFGEGGADYFVAEPDAG